MVEGHLAFRIHTGYLGVFFAALVIPAKTVLDFYELEVFEGLGHLLLLLSGDVWEDAVEHHS